MKSKRARDQKDVGGSDTRAKNEKGIYYSMGRRSWTSGRQLKESISADQIDRRCNEHHQMTPSPVHVSEGSDQRDPQQRRSNSEIAVGSPLKSEGFGAYRGRRNIKPPGQD